VFAADLICSDEDCAEAVEATGTLEELDLLVCDGCGCTLQVLALWAVEELRLELPPTANDPPLAA
jgi:hypothetical protein